MSVAFLDSGVIKALLDVHDQYYAAATAAYNTLQKIEAAIVVSAGVGYETINTSGHKLFWKHQNTGLRDMVSSVKSYVDWTLHDNSSLAGVLGDIFPNANPGPKSLADEMILRWLSKSPVWDIFITTDRELANRVNSILAQPTSKKVVLLD